MRKISKNRTDDDVISSTNGSGSVANDDQNQQESEPISGTQGKDPIDVPDKQDTESEDSQGTPIKTPKEETKGRKRKSNKTNNKKEVEEEYEVEKIVDSKKIKGKLHYLIRWKGYSANSDTWEPEDTLSCPDLINKFNDTQKENSKAKDTNSKQNKKRKAAAKGKGAKKAKTADTDDDDDDNEDADENAEYEVERILEVHHKKNGEREFFIHWKGWSNKYDSWEPESNLNCPELIKKFMNKVSAARSTESRNLRVAPETTNRFTLQDPSSGRRLSKRRGQRQRVRYDNAE